MLRSRPAAVFLLAGSVAAQVLPPGSTRWSPDRFIEYVVGNAPIVISAGHGGSLEPPSIPDRTYGTFAKDTRTIELAREFAEVLKGRDPRDVVAMCGSGVTACHLLLALEHAGLEGARLFTGSWSGWIDDPARPVARWS